MEHRKWSSVEQEGGSNQHSHTSWGFTTPVLRVPRSLSLECVYFGQFGHRLQGMSEPA